MWCNYSSINLHFKPSFIDIATSEGFVPIQGSHPTFSNACNIVVFSMTIPSYANYQNHVQSHPLLGGRGVLCYVKLLT